MFLPDASPTDAKNIEEQASDKSASVPADSLLGVFVVDMNGFDILSPDVLSMLVDVKKRCAARNIEVRLSGVSPEMRILLKKTLLDIVFPEQNGRGENGDGPENIQPEI